MKKTRETTDLTHVRVQNENYYMYITDIRNLKKLDTETIHHIPNLSNEAIIQILTAYNDVTDAFCKFIEYSTKT